MNTPRKGGLLIVFLIGANALYATVGANQKTILDFAGQYTPYLVPALSVLVLFLMVFGPSFAAVLSYLLHPRQFFAGGENAETPAGVVGPPADVVPGYVGPNSTSSTPADSTSALSTNADNQSSTPNTSS